MWLRSFVRAIAGGIGIVVIFIALSRFDVLKPLRLGISAVVSPAFARLTPVIGNIRDTLVAPLRISQMRRQIAELEDQLSAQLVQRARFAELERENRELRRELSFFERETHRLITARIFYHGTEAGAQTFTLNRGALDGVVLGAPVTAGGTLIGKIVQLQNHVSIAAPLWVSPLKTAATFAGSEFTEGIVEGELNAGLKMTLIAKDADVREGMVVITSGLEKMIPRGLVIGTVERVEGDPNDLFQSAFLKPPIFAKDITIVSILDVYDW